MLKEREKILRHEKWKITACLSLFLPWIAFASLTPPPRPYVVVVFSTPLDFTALSCASRNRAIVRPSLSLLLLMAAACAPGLLSPALPKALLHRCCKCKTTPKPSSTASCRRRIVGTRAAAVSARASPAAAVARGLDADDFRHPLDKQNTLLLRAIPGLNDMGKALLGPVSEQVMVLQNIGTSVLVSENQLPELHHLLIEAAKTLNTEAPDLYIRQNPVPNAYTLAINGKKPFIVVHTSLVELLTRKELQAVLAHELGHLKCDHGVWLTFANILTMGAYTVPGFGMVAGFLEEQLYRWLRAAELTCDRAALLVVQDPKVVISVLMKLAGGCPSLADQLNVDAFLEQARSYDKASSSPVGWYIRNAQTRELSHPLPVMRAREIDEWSRSQEFRTVLQKLFQQQAGVKQSIVKG